MTKRKPDVTHEQHKYTYLIHHSAATSAQNIKRQVVLWAHSSDRTVKDMICVQPQPCTDLPVVFRNTYCTITNKRRGGFLRK